MAVSAQLAQEWLGDDYEDEDVVYFDQEEQDYDEDDDDDYGPGVTIFKAPPSPEPEPTTDLAEQAYTDPLALVNAWEGALQDYKDSHPDQFLPPAEAPRTLAQKKVKAPFWYGPPPSEASTSKLVQATTTTAIMIGQEPRQAVEVTYESYFGESAAQVEQRRGSGVEQEQTAEPEEEEEEGGEGTQRRKRKRLTGSQKKARKAAKLGLKSTAGGGGGGAEAAQTTHRQPSPIYSPRSPKFQAAARPVDVQATTSGSTPPVPSSSLPPTNPASTLAAAQSSGVRTPSDNDPKPSRPAAEAPPPPSAFRFLVPPMSTLPRQFPPPPAITPLTGTEPPLDPETPEQLLESALWSWYSAGYQTALYHAAVGVAKFAPSAETSEE
ncbi:hypothetical protein RHOSPDRAFT_32350 [Rhodotorula sp. JG-1b]|nr:hypothetical protein RHOSPDRAFT_32350 [Rhodotorula sp. JG-1b]